MRKAAIVYCCMRKTVHCRHAQEWNVRVFPVRQWPELGKTGKCLCSTLTLYGSQGLPSSRCEFGHLRLNAVGFHDSRWSRLGRDKHQLPKSSWAWKSEQAAKLSGWCGFYSVTHRLVFYTSRETWGLPICTCSRTLRKALPESTS